MSDRQRRPERKPELSLLPTKAQTPLPASDAPEQQIGPLSEPATATNKEAFIVELYTEQALPLVKYLTARFRNATEAQDIAQEAWLRIFRLAHPQELGNAKAFLFQTASNLAIDRVRRGKLEQKYLDQELGLAEPGLAPSMERTVAGTQDLEQVEQALLQLPLKCRQAFVAHRSQGLPYAEIARQLGVSTSMVEKYIIQALRHLRQTLNP